MKKINLDKVLADPGLLEQLLGPADAETINIARLILRQQFPTGLNESERAAYITRCTQAQDALINLHMRLAHSVRMLSNERASYWGRLMYREEYEGRDKEAIALSQDAQYRDMHDTIGTLEVVREAVGHLLWTVKDAMKKA